MGRLIMPNNNNNYSTEYTDTDKMFIFIGYLYIYLRLIQRQIDLTLMNLFISKLYNRIQWKIQQMYY